MSQTRLNVAQLKTLGHDDIATDAELANAILEHKAEANPHVQYVTEVTIDARVGVPGGYAPLDSNGLIPSASIPVQTVTTIVQTMSMDGGTF